MVCHPNSHLGISVSLVYIVILLYIFSHSSIKEKVTWLSETTLVSTYILVLPMMIAVELIT